MTMNKVYACIDGRSNTDAVIDWAAWAALRLALPLEFLHVLERHSERADVQDLSGAIGPDAQDTLLRQLSGQDEQRSKAAREAGRSLLAAARERALRAGPLALDVRLRHGEFVATVAEMGPDAALFVLGEHHHAGGGAKVHADHQLERVIRAVQQPVLVATTEAFEAPQRIVLAFDGSANARRAVQALSRHALSAGLPVLLVTAGQDTAAARRQLDAARSALAAQGREVDTALVPGEPQHVLPGLVRAQGPALLVIGAYGHSRLRQLIVGSTTSTLLRLSDVPVLILR
jgi:nucleotide-binding universal stress UspA family protein